MADVAAAIIATAVVAAAVVGCIVDYDFRSFARQFVFCFLLFLLPL